MPTRNLTLEDSEYINNQINLILKDLYEDMFDPMKLNWAKEVKRIINETNYFPLKHESTRS